MPKIKRKKPTSDKVIPESNRVSFKPTKITQEDAESRKNPFGLTEEKIPIPKPIKKKKVKVD